MPSRFMKSELGELQGRDNFRDNDAQNDFLMKLSITGDDI